MRICHEIRKIITRYGRDLRTLLPDKEYEDLVESYANGHNPPSERKQVKDLRYLRHVLKI